MSQIRYVNNTTGRDIDEYSGSVDKPFKTISYAINRSDDGDEIQLVDMSMVAEGVYHEDSPVSLENRNNITIRFGNVSPGGKPSGMKWELGSGDYALKLNRCHAIKLIGVIFICENDHQTGCVDVTDSDEIEFYSCSVDNFIINSAQENLFNVTRSSVTFTNMEIVSLSDSSGEFEEAFPKINFISLNGDTIANVYSCSIKDYYSEKSSITAVYCDQDVRTLNVNGILMHNCESCSEDGSTGIWIEADAGSFIDFDIMNCQFSHIRTGIIIKNLPPVKKQAVLRIANCTFYRCSKAVSVYDSDFTVTNINIYGTGDEGEPVYTYKIRPDGEDVVIDVYGIVVSGNSSVSVINTVVTFCNTCFASYDNSLIEVFRTIFCDNTYFKEELDDGEVTVDDYVRSTDPYYDNVESLPYGNFKLKNNSPCINAGKIVGLPYTGSAPNIGAIDQDRYISSSDIVSIAARELRNAETYHMTETDVEDLIVSGLKALNPDSSADREGSAIRDLFVKPITELSEAFLSELDGIRNGMSFLNIESMTEDEADALAANLVVTRKSGAKATGVVRMFFDRVFDFDLPAEAMFSTSSGLHFYSIDRTVLSKEEMQANFDGSLYYVDVILEGESVGAAYNVSPGEITACNDINASSLIMVTNNGYFAGGESRETNKELYERVKLSITTRCLNTTKGVKFQFIEAFTFLRRVTAIGKGDSEMIRDDLLSLFHEAGIPLPIDDSEAALSNVHIGGKTDVYTQVYEPIEDSVVVDAIPETATLTEIGLTDKPILRITSIEICDPLTKDTIGVTIPSNKWTLICNDPRTRFSTRENMSMSISEDYIGDTVKINYMWAYEIAAMQKWAESDDNRVICEDILVKHCQPAFVSLSAAYHASEEVEDMEKLIREYIMSIPEKKSLRVSDLIDFIYEQRAVHVITPLLITATLHKNNGSIERYESFDEIILERTACFIPDIIEISYLGEDPV